MNFQIGLNIDIIEISFILPENLMRTRIIKSGKIKRLEEILLGEINETSKRPFGELTSP